MKSYLSRNDCEIRMTKVGVKIISTNHIEIEAYCSSSSNSSNPARKGVTAGFGAGLSSPGMSSTLLMLVPVRDFFTT